METFELWVAFDASRVSVTPPKAFKVLLKKILPVVSKVFWEVLIVVFALITTGPLMVTLLLVKFDVKIFEVSVTPLNPVMRTVLTPLRFP